MCMYLSMSCYEKQLLVYILDKVDSLQDHIVISNDEIINCLTNVNNGFETRPFLTRFGEKLMLGQFIKNFEINDELDLELNK